VVVYKKGGPSRRPSPSRTPRAAEKARRSPRRRPKLSSSRVTSSHPTPARAGVSLLTRPRGRRRPARAVGGIHYLQTEETNPHLTAMTPTATPRHIHPAAERSVSPAARHSALPRRPSASACSPRTRTRRAPVPSRRGKVELTDAGRRLTTMPGESSPSTREARQEITGHETPVEGNSPLPPVQSRRLHAAALLATSAHVPACRVRASSATRGVIGQLERGEVSVGWWPQARRPDWRPATWPTTG